MKSSGLDSISRGQVILAACWLVSVLIANTTEHARWWYVVLAASIMLALTVLVSRCLPFAKDYGIRPVRMVELVAGAASGVGLFLLYYLVCRKYVLASEGHFLLWSVLVSPVTEELAFRCVFYRVFSDWGQFASASTLKRLDATRNISAVLVVAVVFAAFHLPKTRTAFLIVFGAGVLYGLLRWRTDNVFPAMASHLAYNATIVVMLGR